MFKGMYTDNSGTITVEELKHGLSKQGTRLLEYEVKHLEAVRYSKYSTIEELEHALREYGMNNYRDIKEVILDHGPTTEAAHSLNTNKAGKTNGQFTKPRWNSCEEEDGNM
ncbi:calcium-dependent protein kinase 2-like protein [Tanacetum coccineum]|uniref:Calcium-dependent protein kinase 2-like protein n=1 Tax=Tanacetum coccineum TaxID=301880 RepID=A0ABQ4XDM0_9ASTR